MVPQRMRHAHQRATSADTGDEAVEPNADLLDELGPGRVLMREHVARVLELPGGVQVALCPRVLEQCSDRSIHALLQQA